MKTLDTRDLYKRKCELEDLRDTLTDAREALEDAKQAFHESEKEEPEVTSEGVEAWDKWSEKNDTLEDAASEAESNVEAALIDFGEDEESELAELETLENEISEFRHGETMIPEDAFEDYARELAEDLGYMDSKTASSWPFTCINWSEAADELRQDYSEAEYQGQTYLARS
jgi:hypothetical protein